jgi:hypothetical protein
LLSGRYKYPFLRGDMQWQCGCGNMLFQVTPDIIYCPNCGKEQVFP